MPAARHWLLLAVVLFAVPAVAFPGQAGAANSTGRDAEAIKAALHGWVEAFNAQDWPRTLDLWDETAVIISPGRPDTHFPELQAAARERRQPSNIRRSYEVQFEEIEVGGDMAYVRDIWLLTTTDRTTGQSNKTRQRSLEIWRKRSGGTWKVTRAVLFPEEAVADDNPDQPQPAPTS